MSFSYFSTIYKYTQILLDKREAKSYNINRDKEREIDVINQIQQNNAVKSYMKILIDRGIETDDGNTGTNMDRPAFFRINAQKRALRRKDFHQDKNI